MNENKKINEEQLEQAAGGGICHDLCFFTPTGKTKEENGAKWAECKSNCGNIGSGIVTTGCLCHGVPDRCVNKWHRIDNVTEELWPGYSGNHAQKLKSNNYNT